MFRKEVLTVTALLQFVAPSFGDEADAKAAKMTWSSFACMTYARLAGEDSEATRLFEVGYAAGQQFIAAVEAGTITDEEGRANVPVGVAGVMAGPSSEFILGRIFEAASSNAYEQVTRQDANGLYLSPDQWAVGAELIQSLAAGRYQRSNCDLL